MLDPKQTHDEVIAPTLSMLALDSLAARQITLGTGMTESGLTYIKQVGGGPALGLWQMEPVTHDDIWVNFLAHRRKLAQIVEDFCQASHVANDMTWNLRYACAMARVHYYRRPEALPAAGDATGMAAYWKQHYNTPLGAGTVAKALPHFVRAIELVRA